MLSEETERLIRVIGAVLAGSASVDDDVDHDELLDASELLHGVLPQLISEPA